MRRSVPRTFAALAVAGAMLTTSAVALAAPARVGLAIRATTKRATTLTGLSPALRREAVRRAQSRPGATTLGNAGGTSASGPNDFEPDDACGGDWFITWEEDGKGTPIIGTFKSHCDGEAWPIG